MNEREKIRVSELVIKSLENKISAEEFKELDAYVSSSKENALYFTNCIATYMGISDYQEIAVSGSSFDEASFDKELWMEMSQYEKMAPTIQIEKPPVKREPVKVIKMEKPPRQINKFSLCAAIISTAAAILVFLMVASSPVRLPVAMLTDSIDAQWQMKKNIPANGDILRQGTLMLTDGLAEITFDYGARVIVEGPAELQLESAGKMSLLWGRAYATVPEHATGFIMQTPNSMIVDMGTEFGVIVDHDGETEVHMVNGQSSLVPGQEGKTQKGQLLTAGQARRIDTSQKVHTIKVNIETLVRHFTSESSLILRGRDTLSLADMVGGGNGTGTGIRGHGISLETGGLVLINKNQGRLIKKSFSEVHSSPYINSVFIPNGKRGDVVISTLGTSFSGFPPTEGKSTDDIYNQGETILYAIGMGGIDCPAMLNGKLYGNQSSPVIYMHSNAGITFDLAAIRSLIGDSMTISGFRTVCGIPEGLQEDNVLGYANLDLWVLVDGQERFKRLSMKSDAAAEEVAFSLTGKERFLTLAVTAGDDTLAMDLALFGDPVLMLSSASE